MKKYVVLASLVLAFSLVACGGSAEARRQRNRPIVTAYGETAKGIVAKYQAAKTAEEVKAVNTESAKPAVSFQDLSCHSEQVQGRYRREKFGEEGNELGKLITDAKNSTTISAPPARPPKKQPRRRTRRRNNSFFKPHNRRPPRGDGLLL